MDSEDDKIHVYDVCLDPTEEHNMLPNERNDRPELLELFGMIQEKATLERLATQQGHATQGDLRNRLKTLGYID